ncbi:PspC domain-containing protein [Ferruginibacter lapsinanis]|uniref:PspC domain-containing protein n=1 Tax=Ferruginibacter lapsinanis TaxID=563172 RepID=UPI001E54AEE7|nr:PspC domain-containing protein [Ferruginibacter lapsinanis]UEG50806.1 PspC domain-containing protein [Ferruginibacter lapsinanis]
MKQVININFHGQVVPIEVSAFDILKKYTESLGRYFANEEGKEEIINDIESRIGELFQERLKKGATCITDDDVNAIIKSMGRPEDFETVEENTSSASAGPSEQSNPNAGNATATPKRLYRNENDKVIGGVCSGLANYFGLDPILVRIIFVVISLAFGTGILAYFIMWVAVPSTATAEIGGTRKKLYRDSDDKIIAGVGSGIGNYFGVSAWIPRVLFLLPFLSFVFKWGHFGFLNFPDFLRFSFSPGALIVYIILWLVLPEAVTTAEKLEMKGEKVDLNSIKNSVMEEMKGVQGRAEKFGTEAAKFAEEKGKTVGSEMGSVARRSSRSLGDVIVFLVKAFAYFVIGCVGFALVAALFAFAIAAIGVFPLKDFLLRDGWQSVLAWGTLLFFVAVPVIGVITWIIRRLAKAKGNRKIIRFSFISLWIVGWVCFIFLLALVSKDFRTSNDIAEHEIALSNPSVSGLEFVGPDDLILQNKKNRWLKISPFAGVTDEDTVFVNNVHFRILKSPNDSFQLTIIKLANGYSRQNADSLASLIDYVPVQKDSIVQMPSGIAITTKSKFRNQHVVINVYVPVGKKIKINQNIWESEPEKISIGIDSEGSWDDYWGNEERGWTTNVEYIMKADGLYTLDGNSVKEGRHGNHKLKIDEHGVEIRDGNNHIKIDANGVNIITDDKDEIKQRRFDSLEAKQEREKDSVNRALEQKQLKEKEKILKESPSAYTSPIGLPIMNSMM